MYDYSFLKKCGGTCKKGKSVSDTNCIGVNPKHNDCKYSTSKGFQVGFCPYYCPTKDEKNYTDDIENIEGIRYMRRPFGILWYFIAFPMGIVSLYSIIKGNWEMLLFFSKGMILYSVVGLIINLLGNYLYVKIWGDTLIAIVNDEGIYTPRLFISWDKIKKVKTVHRPPSRRRNSIHLVELEFVMNVDGLLRYKESVYIYFSTFKMRYHIRKHLKHQLSEEKKYISTL